MILSTLLISGLCLTFGAGFYYFLPINPFTTLRFIKPSNNSVLSHLGERVSTDSNICPVLFTVKTRFGDVNLATDSADTFTQLSTILYYTHTQHLVRPFDSHPLTTFESFPRTLLESHPLTPFDSLPLNQVVYFHDIGKGAFDAMNAMITAAAIAEDAGYSNLGRGYLNLASVVNNFQEDYPHTALDVGVYIPWLITLMFAQHMDIVYKDPDAVYETLAALRKIA